MKGGKRPLGYTIVEVMIVLAISGVMFLIAATFINGKQQSAAFRAGVNQMASNLQNIINQVSEGQYSDIPLNCSSVGGTVAFGAAVNNGQGTNPDCIFLGKVVHFSVNNVQDNYEVISVAGSRADSTGALSTSVSDADAQYIPGLTEQQVVPQSLQVNEVQFANSKGRTKYSCGLGFMQSLASYSGGILNNQALTVEMYYVSGLGDNMSGDGNGDQGEEQIQGNLIAADSVNIYVTDGTYWADIVIGTNGTGTDDDQLAVSVNMLPTGTTPLVNTQC